MKTQTRSEIVLEMAGAALSPAIESKRAAELFNQYCTQSNGTWSPASTACMAAELAGYDQKPYMVLVA